MNNIIDLTNIRFGNLIAIERTEIPAGKRKGFYWLCKCDCGNEKIANGVELRSGHTKSCGCLLHTTPSSFIDLTGKRFGRLIVISRANTPRGHKYCTRWLCKCDCGNETTTSIGNLKKGISTSCGCYRKEIISLPDGEASKNSIYRTYRDNASKRNIVFSLSKEEVFEIIIKNCFYCGEKPSNISRNTHNCGDFIYNGIDRIDSSKGYIKNNVVPSCWMCNHSKNNVSIDDFDKWIEKVYKHRILPLTK